MEVEIISREYIEPSSPTPNHLRTYKISLLDQFAPHIYGPILVFYHSSNQASISKRLQVLKQSLSKTLTRYYPLAGKAKDNLSIDCNDEGACYIEARVNSNLCDYLMQPDHISTLSKFMAGEIIFDEVTPGADATMIQVTVFTCGSISIGVVVPHSLFDATALVVFMKTWATIARDQSIDDDEIVALSPNFSASSIFPQNSALPHDLTASEVLSPLMYRKAMTTVLRRFVFDGSVINNLKSKAMSLRVQNPTRAEIVFAFLFKFIMSALKVKSGTQKSAFISNAVNLRRRAMPPFSESYAGNFVWILAMSMRGTDFVSFVRPMREAISVINGDFVKRLQGYQGMQTLCESMKELRDACSKALSEGAEPISLNSWCNMGL